MEEAIAAFEKAIKLDGDLMTARFWLANARYQRGDVDEAIRLFHELLEVCPQFTAGWYALGLAAVQKNDHDLTREAFG